MRRVIFSATNRLTGRNDERGLVSVGGDSNCHGKRQTLIAKI